MRGRLPAVLIALATLHLSPIALTPASAAVANGVGVVQGGLVFSFDAANPNGGTGTSLTNLVTSNSGVSGILQAGVSRPSSNGNTYSFDGGTSSYATVSIGSTDFTSGFSLSFYAKFSSGTLGDRTFERIIDFAVSAASGGDANNSMWVGRQIDSNDLAVEVWNGYARPNNCRAVNAIQPNVFTHYAVTVNGSTCSFYVNKVLQTTTGIGGINPPLANRASAFIGKSNWSDDYFKGEIGEIAMYNSVLSQNDINQNFDAQTDITAPTLTSPASPYLITMVENTTAAGTLIASTANFYTIVGGADSGKFRLTGAALSFIDPPNFESPTDTAPFNSYIVTIRIMDANGNYGDWTVTVNISDATENSTLTAPVWSGQALKGVNLTVTVTPAGDTAPIPGKLTYFLAGKRIPGCINKVFSGTGNSTCTWKPSIQGNRQISVTFTPTNTKFRAASSNNTIFILKRTTRR